MSEVRVEVLTEPELVALRARTLAQTRWTEDGLRELGRDYQLTADEQVVLDELDRIDFLLGKPPRARTRGPDMDNDTRSALRELGQAWRTDGNHYSPHSILTHLRDVENVADAQITLAQFRNENGLCPSGRGHWSKHCQDDC